MVILDAEKVYNQVHTQAYKECLDMHLISLELLFEMAGSGKVFFFLKFFLTFF